MRAAILLVTLQVSVLSLAVVVTSVLDIPPRAKLLDCGRAEIHPDYSKQMREACRKIRNASN